MPARLGTRRTRRPTTFRLHKPVWVDPYPAIPGTEPEKRIFEQLMRLGLYFVFQGDTKDLREQEEGLLLHNRDFKPDFILPEYKVIIDPFGIYHHTLKEAIKRDFWKGVVYSGAGYSFYHPWWGDKGWEWNQNLSYIERKRGGHPNLSVGTTAMGYDTLGVLLRMPELWRGIKYPLKDEEDKRAKRERGYRLGKNLGAGANSVAAANKARTRAKAKNLRVGNRRKVRRGRTTDLGLEASHPLTKKADTPFQAGQKREGAKRKRKARRKRKRTRRPRRYDS